MILADRVFGIDLRALGVFRIVLAVLVLCDLWERAPDIAAFYTDSGTFSRAALVTRSPIAWGWHLSVYMLSGSTWAQTAWMIIAALWAIALLVGYRTTIATVVTWYLLLALQWRNSLIANSADDLMRFMLFWSMFLPLGARFSLDAKTGHGPKLPNDNGRFLSVSSAALLLQVGIMYWFAAAAKTDPSWRVDGMAVYYTLSIELYATPIGQFFLNFPQLLYYATFGTLWLEGLGPTLAFSPIATSFFRTVVPIAFFLFHLVFLNLCLDLGAFHYVAAACWIPFLPSAVWDKLLPKTKRDKTSPTAQATFSEGERRRYKRVSIAVSAFTGFYIFYVFIWNARDVFPGTWMRLFPHTTVTDRIAELPHLDQGWKMFAPKPFTENGWYVIPAKLKDGTTFDMMRGESSIGQPVSWEKPKMYISYQFKNERWRRYIMNLWGSQYVDQRPNYTRYLCHEWNRTHTGDKQLISVQVYYMLQETLDNYEQAPVRKILLEDWRCDENKGAPTKAAGKLDTSGRGNAIDTHASH